MLDVQRQDTSRKILDVSEQLFVEHGFDATSLRIITNQAGVNLAAVNYHFGSKDNLFKAVFVRRFDPFVKACLEQLNIWESSLSGDKTAKSLLMTFVQPCLNLSKDPNRGGAVFVKLLARTLVENHRFLRDALSEQYKEFIVRYEKAFAQIYPNLKQEEIVWRMHFTFSLMFDAFAGNDILKIFGKSQVVSARDPDAIVKHLVPFILAGLDTPALAQ